MLVKFEGRRGLNHQQQPPWIVLKHQSKTQTAAMDQCFISFFHQFYRCFISVSSSDRFLLWICFRVSILCGFFHLCSYRCIWVPILFCVGFFICVHIHWRNTLQQLDRVGPKSLGVYLLTSAFVGMAFTIQFVREFTRLGLNRAVGGVLALAFARELSPMVTSIVVAGRIGSAFAAELGTMQVSEQTDTLCVLGSDPVDI